MTTTESGVTLRPVRESDAAELARLVIADRPWREPFEIEREPDFYTLAGQEKMLARWVRAEDQRHFLVLAHGSIVGVVNLSIGGRDGPAPEVGYWIVHAENGHGYATAAVDALVRIAFDALGLDRLVAMVEERNESSQAVARRAGFTLVGPSEQGFEAQGVWHDELVFELTEAAYRTAVNEGR